MQDIDGAARLRAAFAYAKLSKKERAAALGVGERHVTRYESGEIAVPTDRWAGVIEATGVPYWFVEDGFTARPVTEEPTTTERLEALEGKVESLLRQFAADERRQPPGALGQDAQGSPPTEPRRGQGGLRPGRGAQSDSAEA